jgi:DNA-binding MarR family transcriptional regulator
MKSHFEILEHSAVRFGYRMAVLANWYRGPGYKRIEKEFGLTEPECSALFCIGHSAQMSATDVCAITGRPKNSMSRAIGLLLDKGLVEREVDSVDGRKKRLKLTSLGQQTYQQIVPIFQESEMNIVSPLTPSELSDFDRLLSKMTKYVTQRPKPY